MLRWRDNERTPSSLNLSLITSVDDLHRSYRRGWGEIEQKERPVVQQPCLLSEQKNAVWRTKWDILTNSVLSRMLHAIDPMQFLFCELCIIRVAIIYRSLNLSRVAPYRNFTDMNIDRANYLYSRMYI